jgi:Ca-activated chloride channel family protein
MSLLLLAFLVAAVGGLVERQDLAEARQVDPKTSAFRAIVDLVSLNVTVTNADQHYVGDLTQSDFTVLENGVSQPIRYFARTGVPLSVALLIDTSSSMVSALPFAQEAAIGFVRQITEGDLVTIVDFETRVEISQALTGDIGALERAIRRTQAGGATSLYNALDMAIQELRGPTPGDGRAVPRRRVIILLSDGEDTSSVVTFDKVLERALRSDTVIYGIGLGLGGQPVGGSDRESGEIILRRFAQQTGGRAFFSDHPGDLAGFFGLFANELTNQYLLAYESPPPHDGKWRRIDVRIGRPNTTARTRAGYLAAVR